MEQAGGLRRRLSKQAQYSVFGGDVLPSSFTRVAEFASEGTGSQAVDAYTQPGVSMIRGGRLILHLTTTIMV